MKKQKNSFRHQQSPQISLQTPHQNHQIHPQPNKDKELERRLKLHQLTFKPKEKDLTQAIEMVNRLEQMGFNDTGNLTNAYPFEKIEILALAIYSSFSVPLRGAIAPRELPALKH